MVAILAPIALMVVGIPGTSHGTERDNSSHSLRAVLSDSFSASVSGDSGKVEHV